MREQRLRWFGHVSCDAVIRRSDMITVDDSTKGKGWIGVLEWLRMKLMGERLYNWATQVEDELKLMTTTETAEMQQWSKQSIYKVPEGVTVLNRSAYRPEFVSFGPYHHMESHLEPMEKHKRRALLHFLKRSRKPLASYIAALAEVAQSLKDSYESLDPIWEDDSDRFLELMILDGCFMLEVMRTSTLEMDDYSVNDPIFSKHGKLHVVPYIRRDMMMLENQLPMLLLTTLVAVEKEEGTEGKWKEKEKGKGKEIVIISWKEEIAIKDEEFVNKLIREFCFPNPWFALDSSIGKCLHLLDVYRSSLLMEDTRERIAFLFMKRRSTGGAGNDEVIRSAMELSDAGIRFKKSRSASLNDISFTGAGVLSLPPIVLDDTTEFTFLNLIAFERFHVEAGNEVTSYIFFMSKIIQRVEDVSLLHAAGIIKNAIGSDKAVVKLFDSLSRDVTLDPDSSLYELHGKVNRYWKERRMRVYLMHNYFRNPWAILSLIAAVFLFFFTLAQTAYTILSYHDPTKNSR
ncbi:hypothetical protein RHMOL_Rhmol12G0031300 [Rhododendron molle]|uniref:Uncharacterized protein n=1 Tax=Rhododendron molle TaxID=49168 RepID=A0ACC0LDS1_RHOML|nr:hypothetical protein RHMOL_Rhmol12G0031300 [Rhododendron molle]